jgi:glycosyltransferase involved in cell wall biosynthesis
MKLREQLLTRLRIRRKSAELRPWRVQANAIRQCKIIAVCCARNEMPRIPGFLNYYRQLGVDHFLVVDNESTDGLAEFLGSQPDCSVWVASGSYKASNFGMDWCNHLLARHGVGKWCLTVDPDEFLVYPHCEERGLRSLTRFMEGMGQDSLFAPLLDAYSEGPLSQACLTDTSDPFAVCPYFDRFNFTQRYNETHNNIWVQGGVRMRRFFTQNPERSPALNKVPLVRWHDKLFYISSMHHLNDPHLNCTVMENPAAVSGILFHFKYVNLLTHKALEEMKRGEHYAGSVEYKAYLEAGDPVLFDPQISVRYRDSAQLRQLGFMQAGGWY